jgi:CelD/BcsL family acetyltransferase involved in cellulose biosynthesis
MKRDIIDTLEEFAALQDNWNELLCHSALENPFQSHQWFLTWWQVYGNGELYIITCSDDISGKLLGALPLYKSRIGNIVPLTVLRFLGSGQGSADFLGCLARQGIEHLIFKACLDILLKSSDSWDLIELQDMDADSLFYLFLKDAGIHNIVEMRDQNKRCPYLALPNSWDGLVNGVSKKVRQRIGYYRRALDKKGVVTFELLEDPSELAGALSDMIRLRQDRMEQKGITTAPVTDSYYSFHGQLMPRLLECGKLKFYFLRLDGERIAYLYLFSGGSSVYFYQTGFDRTWSSQSVGFVLLGMVLEKTIADGYTVFEFLRGLERYKFEWGVVGEKYLVDLVIPGRTLSVKFWLFQFWFKKIARNLFRFISTINLRQ